MENRKNPETLRPVAHAWLFDVDGVITNPETRKPDSEVVSEIRKKLASGQPVAIITGRSFEWLDDTLLRDFEAETEDKSTLDNLFVSTEFGGMHMDYTGGKRNEPREEDQRIPEDVAIEAKKEIEKNRNTVFLDTSKRTTLTAEMNHRTIVDDFKPVGRDLFATFQKILSEKNASDFVAHLDTIAVNIRHKNANKSYATAQALKWVRVKGMKPESYYVFGDSPSDIEMGEELERENLPFEFVYVGKKKPDQKVNFPITFTGGNYEKDTAVFLKGIAA